MRSRAVLPLVAIVVPGAAIWALLSPPGERPSAAAAATGPLLILYSEPDFGGHVLEVTGTLADLPVVRYPDGTEFDWNDRIRSVVVVRGAWKVFENGRLNRKLDDTPIELLDLSTKELAKGWSTLLSATSLGALEIPSPEAGGFGDDVSSIELVSEENLPDWAAP